MTLHRTGEIHEFIIADQRELMGYLDVEGSEGRELLPLLKSKLGSALRSQVQSVRYRAPNLIVMVEKTLEPAELRGENLGTMRPVCIRTMSLDESQLKVSGHFGLTEALINTCTEPDVAVELGLMWLADTETASLRKEVESLKAELDSAREINTLLIDLAKTLAEEKGAQLQEQIIEKATSAMPHMTALNSNPMYDDLADLFRSSLGGSLENDIRTEVIERINELHIVDRIALCLCEPDEVLENWVDNQYGEFPTPTSCIDIKLSCDTLIDQMTRAVERRIHEAIEA
jgi:hypothetical protein